MKLNFNIDYRTNWGESVYIVASIPQLGGGDEGSAVKMELDGVGLWTLSVDVPEGTPAFDYRYLVRHDNGYVRHEWGCAHRFVPGYDVNTFEIYDRWQEQPYDKPYYSSVFVDCINRRDHRDAPLSIHGGTLTINVDAPMVGSDEVLAICGDNMALGEWDPSHAVVMNDCNFPQWSVNIDFRELDLPFRYKFVILKKDTLQLLSWENGDNRLMNIIPEHKSSALVISGLRLNNSRPSWRGAGVAIPVFSVRSNDDFGVGDFYDLKLMVDWAVATGQKFLQILPINDTTMTHTWTDSYPYKANSTFALHPMFLRLSELGRLDDEGRQRYFDDLAKELNALPAVDYERVNNAKNEFTREIFKQEGAKTLGTLEFKEFVNNNESWLKPYAAFCLLRDKNGTAQFDRWGEYAVYDADKIERFVEDNRTDIDYVYYIQYHLDKQMREVHRYAGEHGVAFKGDIPIGISRDSADAWINPRLFNLDCQAGAPPDDFSVLGQNWGLPTYNWEEMSKDGFAWWKARFRKMSEYFDAYRIDHVLGFFRIWQIPMDAVHGLLGIFNPALPYTPDELRNNYDFWLDIDLQTTPFIMDYFLYDFFGEFTDEAKRRFLISVGYGRFKLRPEFDTQRKIVDYFAGEEKCDKNDRLCKALMGLVDEVLFIEDPYEKGKYHPRISAQFTYIYRSLTDYERWCFNRLYNDFYYHRHNDFWYGKAMWKLPPLIDSTTMLTCAEDLGMIPDCVPAVMSELQMLSLEIQRMPKDPAAEFGNTWTYPYLSVCTTSTHDMGGIRQWWEENRDVTQHYYNNMLHESGAAPRYAEPWVCDKIITLNLQSPSMLAIFPLQDWLSINGILRRENPHDELINIPANPRHYWRYRMHLTVEELLSASEFNGYLRDKIRSTGR
ncbi:MAG TPA: 4-alpha-glucanotransferase [Muribaculum sp.]|jgi:4-alpha-glucanotransferase|uniref:4-alpha-glucanotransferase n=1 Tax=Heminiphilus faecis TaxID=2601703 RepID=UPI000EF5C85D|nr:4-alpha-glucanotransferase [Heminiphilus faecis]RLT76996.1 4-alpha-glucanotransferase [bacterium J10(2018)]HRF68499.1 4-alpha-glucanotransferase [Muribaculum sp.]